jgi:hypothetical protein
MNASKYPVNWKTLSREIRQRADDRCECRGECGTGHQTRCEARQGEKTTRSGWPVILTTAHLWRGPCATCHEIGVKCDNPEHLGAFCQACHLAYDAPHHRANAAATRRAKLGNEELPL